MELLYSSGLRLAELVSLDVTSVDLKDRVVQVTGKGRKARIVPVGRLAAEALKVWLKERAALARSSEAALFVGRNGSRLGARAVQLRVAFWARRQGLNVPVHPHLFRSELGREAGVVEYQVRQTPAGAAIAVRCTAPVSLDSLRDRVAAALARAGLERPQVTVETADRLEARDDVPR